MAIEFKARVLLELGAELISSDAVAIYELVKNSIDARSRSVNISFNIALQHSVYFSLAEELQQMEPDDFDASAFEKSVISQIESDAPSESRNSFIAAFGKPRSLSDAKKKLEEAFLAGSYIEFVDTGSGMNKETLQKGYLTIGTPMRLLEKGIVTKPSWTHNASAPSTTTLGEKGIGRLAAMRLGHHVFLKTGTADRGEAFWHHLELDWRPVFQDPTLDASALTYKPVSGPRKEKLGEHGTTITIRALQSDWTDQKLIELCEIELAKLADPFKSDLIQEFLSVRLQGNRIRLGEFDNSKLAFADAICEARFEKKEANNEKHPLTGLALTVEVDYQYYKKFSDSKHKWTIEGEHLVSCISDPVGRRRKRKADEPLPDSDIIAAALPRLGPFSLKFYWFNRGRLRKEDSDRWEKISRFVKNWSGGLLVYRDGFRVHPYGSATDDWLDLDRSALSASAYKLNRAQIIGYLRISRIGNPALQDQTNREGFRDCLEKEALRRLLRTVFITKCRIFLEDIAKAHKEKDDDSPESVDTLEERVNRSEKMAVTQLQKLQRRVPQESESIEEVLFQIGEIRDAWERAKITIKGQESDLEQYIHLAGVGLQVEFIAHELSRVTGDALSALANDPGMGKAASRTALQMQLNTLQKRIRVLDLLSIPGRQRKTLVDINELVEILKEMHAGKLQRHGITMTIKRPRRSFLARVEKGQVLQILDNLFSNSFYWLNHRLDRTKSPQITVELDSEKRTLIFSDNGPGVPGDMGDEVFKPFVTTKPPSEGRGLGLFISRKLAEYNDGTLKLSNASTNGYHHSFVLSLIETKDS